MREESAKAAELRKQQEYQLKQFLDGYAKYYFSEEKLVWHDAVGKCHELGGELASIKSEEENREVHNEILGQEGAFWIGGSDIDQEGVWEWHDRSPFKYTNWHNGEPNNFFEGQDCIQIN